MKTRKTNKISDNTIRRLPRYLRCLDELERQGNTRVSSAMIGNHLNNTHSQVRQDLSQFGSYGMQGYGYNIESLRASIHAILGTDATHTVIIAGIGSLGHALLEHLPLAANGYQILAGFDVDPKLIGQKINGVPILNSEDFGSFIQNNKPAICILTVPTSAAVDYAKQASENGVAAIWNFANVDLSTLGLEAAVENVNLMDSLYTLTYYSRDGE